MFQYASLPLRQKILLAATVLAGVFLVLAYHTRMMRPDTLGIAIFFYGMGVPFSLLASETLLDLNDVKVLRVWCVVAVLFLVAYFFFKNAPDLMIRRSLNYHTSGVNRFISDTWVSALKALPAFLIFYALLNYIVKQATGNYLVNTLRKSKWYNEAAGRKIYWYDVTASIALMLVIVGASLF